MKPINYKNIIFLNAKTCFLEITEREPEMDNKPPMNNTILVLVLFFFGLNLVSCGIEQPKNSAESTVQESPPADEPLHQPDLSPTEPLSQPDMPLPECNAENFMAGKWNKTDVPWIFDFHCDGTIFGWYDGENRGHIGNYRIVDNKTVEIQMFGFDESWKLYVIESSPDVDLFLRGQRTNYMPLDRID